MSVPVKRSSILFPEAAILLVSDGDWDLWPDGILSPQIADFRLHCAESKVKPKMAERREWKWSRYVSGRREIWIRKSWTSKYYNQTETRRDPQNNRFDAKRCFSRSPNWLRKIVNISNNATLDGLYGFWPETNPKEPLNALIRDQVTKLKQSGLKACILKGDRVEGEEEERKEEQEGLAFSGIENLKEFRIIFVHPEALVGNKNVIKLLKSAEFKNRMKASVVDEAHLVVDW